MPTWRVTLTGDPWDLKTLVSMELGLSEEGGGFVWRRPEFDSLTTAHEVEHKAREMIEALNGLGRMNTADFRPVGVGAIVGHEDSGTISLYVGAELTVRSGLPFAAEVIRGGAPVPPSPPVWPGWLETASRVPVVRQALRFFSNPTAENLWKVYEIIRDDVGGKAQILGNGWATEGEIDAFRSVHYPSALGDDARHGVEPTRAAPPHPMPLEQAQAFIKSLLGRWLAAK